MTRDDSKTIDERGSASRTSAPARTARYLAGDEIARGGMGRVVEATDVLLGRVVAVKQVLATDPDALRRFARETRITARLEHPSIVPVYDAGTLEDGSPFYVMRKVSGRPLERVVGDAGTLERRLALLPHVLAAAQAIAHAHARGIIHRDLKPSNILVGELGETVVIDWGLAKVIDEPDDDVRAPDAPPGAGDSIHTRVGLVIGTPGFMPPEQLRGEPADMRADVYALGATLYYLLAHRAPHAAGSGTEMMGAALVGPPTPLAELVTGVPPELSTIVDTALAHDHAARYADAAAFAADLQRFLTGQLVASHQYTSREKLRRFVRKHRVPVTVSLLALVALGVFGALAITRVIAERDRADAQATLATARQREAERARASETERADQLLLVQARTLVATNPTAAVASLKPLTADPQRWDRLWRNARGIAASARVTGIARGLPGPAAPRLLRMSPSGDHAFAIGDDGLWTFDLHARTSRRHAVPLGDPGFVGPVEYLDETRVVWHQDLAIGVVDLATGARTRQSIPATVRMLVAGAGRMFWIDETGAAWWSDGTSPPAPLPVRGGTAIELSPDHTTLAFLDATHAGVLDTATLARHDLGPSGGRTMFWRADSKVFATIYDDRIAVFGAGERVRTIPLDSMAVVAGFRDTQLYLVKALGGWHFESGGRLVPRTGLGEFSGMLGVHTTSRGLIYGVADRIDIVGEGALRSLRPPAGGLRRLATHPTGRFIVGARQGQLYVWDLEGMTPSRALVDNVSQFALLDTDTAAILSDFEWTLLDLTTQRRVPVVPTLPPLVTFTSSIGAHTLAIEVGVEHARAFLVRRDGSTQLLDDDIDMGGVMDDARIVLGTGRGAVVVHDPASGTRTTVMSSPSAIKLLVWRDTWIGALFADGTLRRRDLATGIESSVQAANAGRGFGLSMTPSGSVYFPDGNRIREWRPDNTLGVVATLDSVIVDAVATSDRMFVTTLGGPSYTIDLETAAVTSRIPTGVALVQIDGTADFAVFLDGSRHAMISDLVSGEIWPLDQGDVERIDLARGSLTVGALTRGRARFWGLDVPRTAAETAAWLDELTNATSELGPMALRWSP